MVSGIVERIKGKVAVDQEFITAKFGGVRQFVQTIDASIQSTTIPNSGHTLLKWSSGATKIALDAPVAGCEKVITVTTMSSNHGVVATNSTGVVFFDGFNTFWLPSTLAAQQISISLMGVSSAAWSNLGVNPAVTSTGGVISNGGLGNSS